MIFAAVNAAQPGIANNDGASIVVREVISAASSSISTVRRHRCSTRRRAKSATNPENVATCAPILSKALVRSSFGDCRNKG